MCSAREGVIIDWPLNRLFNNARDVILTSRTDVKEMDNDDDDPERTLVTLKRHCKNDDFLPKLRPLQMFVIVNNVRTLDKVSLG